jgi:glycosyltransferase involved in cell wall biosynthesis
VDAAERHGLPVVVGAQGADVQCVPEISYGASLDPAAMAGIRRVLARADRIVALSRLNRDMLVALGADIERIVVIPNGVAWDAIGAVPREERRPQLGLSRDDFVLITVSRASAVKRMDLLYRALRIARRSAPFLRCVSVGPAEPLRRAARDAGVEDAVVLTGTVLASPPVAELVHLQRAADLFVSVSYVESFGNAALEAVACGTPALLTPRHGVLDVLSEGEAAFVARDETAEGIARLLLELAARRDQLAARRESIRASVAYLTWDEVAARCREVYVSLLGAN